VELEFIKSSPHPVGTHENSATTACRRRSTRFATGEHDYARTEGIIQTNI